MPKVAYPTTSDLTTFLTAAGFSSTLVAGFDLTSAIAAGIRDVEEVNQRTWLGSATASTKRYNPPTNSPVLIVDDLNSLTSLTYQELGGTASTLTADTDFVLLPVNAAAESKPYTRIRFYWHRWIAPLAFTQEGSIRITGKWGYSVVTSGWGMPEPVWLGMLARAAWFLTTQVQFGTTGGLLSRKEADVSEDFGIEPWKALQSTWDSQYRAALAPAYCRFNL